MKSIVIKQTPMKKDTETELLLKATLKYARLDFSEKISLVSDSNGLNELAAAINNLAEKLEASLTAQNELNHQLQNSVHSSLQFEKQQLLLTSIVNLSDDAIISKNLEGIITTWNAGAEKLFGYKSEEIIGRHISVLIPDNLRPEETDIMEKILNGENIEHYETQRLKKDGSSIWVSLTISPIKDVAGNIIGASKISRDITERKLAEKELKKTYRLYSFLSAINRSIAHMTDERTLLITANSIAIKIGKFESARLGLLDDAGRLNMIDTALPPTTGEKLMQYSGTDFSSHLLRDTPAGKVLSTGTFAVSNDAQNDPDLSPFKNELIKTGIRSCASFPIKKFGKTIGVFSFLSSEKDFFDEKEIALLQESVGDISFALEILENDSNRKKAEADIKTLNETLEVRIAERTIQLERANKELESFSYSVAHDLRSPLRGILGYANMLQEDYDALLDPEGRRLLGEVQYNAKKMGQLIDELLTFSKIGRKEVNKTPVDMNQLMTESLAELEKNQQHHATITMLSLHNVMADASLLKHVVMNLLSNAVKYSSKNVNATIEIKSELLDGNVIYSVKDNGVGFDMQFANKLFGVFQRLHTDDEFEGTGVGLAIAQRIIHKHSGKIWADAEEGKGATFFFSLPHLKNSN